MLLLPLLVSAAPFGGFAITHTPAAGSQATISQAAGAAGVKNVAEGVCFGFSATTALAGITTVTVNLRDGATGAGTILQSWQYTLPAAVVAPFGQCFSSLHISGTAATALTLEFSAAVGNLMEYVALTGYTNP
jgi:hypothetical protein